MKPEQSVSQRTQFFWFYVQIAWMCMQNKIFQNKKQNHAEGDKAKKSAPHAHKERIKIGNRSADVFNLPMRERRSQEMHPS